jgi:hypothetical protein
MRFAVAVRAVGGALASTFPFWLVHLPAKDEKGTSSANATEEREREREREREKIN